MNLLDGFQRHPSSYLAARLCCLVLDTLAEGLDSICARGSGIGSSRLPKVSVMFSAERVVRSPWRSFRSIGIFSSSKTEPGSVKNRSVSLGLPLSLDRIFSSCCRRSFRLLRRSGGRRPGKSLSDGILLFCSKKRSHSLEASGSEKYSNRKVNFETSRDERFGSLLLLSSWKLPRRIELLNHVRKQARFLMNRTVFIL